MKLRDLFSWQRLRRHVKSTAPFFTSLALHAATLVVLSLILLPILPGSSLDVLSVSRALFNDEVDDSLAAPSLLSELAPDDTSEQDLPAEGVFEATLEGLPPAINSPLSFKELSPRFGDLAPDPAADRAAKNNRRRSGGMRPDVPVRAPSTTAEIREATSPAVALASVTQAIQRELETDDTLIVWLVDASISLEHDRRLMAEHMETFYRQIGAFDINNQRPGTKLMNAVVAFGRTSQQVLAPNPFGIKVCSSLTDFPVDPSGQERVMTAVQHVLDAYRIGRRDGRTMVVIVTDESGDDTALLEPTISACRECGVPVHVIGPSAVFGTDRGSHTWTDPLSGEKYLLPVLRGPDTAWAQRAWLPYWHESDLPPWRNGDVVSATSTAWYGGAYRERLVSCFGPYALTRLALETGGSFTVLDREADRSRYRLEDMREYLPQYISVAEYEQMLAKHPLRAALSEVALATMQTKVYEQLRPPRMVFISERLSYYPFTSISIYFSPGDFATRFPAALRQEQTALKNKIVVLNELLKRLNSENIQWEAEYLREESPRWRAWYDLTKGRLLATLIRSMEYHQACALLPGLIPRGMNHVSLHDGPDLMLPESQALATEARALLHRCIESNPDTPWASLAQWELDKGFGLGYQWTFIPPPQPRPAAPAVNWSPPRFPSL